MRPVHFSGYQFKPWGSTQLMFDDEKYAPEKVQKEIDKIGAPFNAPKDSFVLLHRLDGLPAASFAIDEEPVEGFLIQDAQGNGYDQLLNKVASYLKETFPKK